MALAQSNVQVFPSLAQTQVIAINGSYPGPTVRITKGQTFTANFQNNLTEPATIHWHGLAVPELMDGHPKDSIPAGGSYTYTFQVNQKAGTFFYPSHADMATARHVYKGFAGFFIIDDPAENVFGLPNGSYDIPLVIQDRRAADIPQFTYAPGMTEMMDGYLGDTVLVNGTPDPYLEVNTTKYRFRILNGSNARVYKIAFSDGRQFSVISTDGGLKDAPANNVSSFFISPGERVEIVVDFAGYTVGQSVTLKSLSFTLNGTGPYKQGTPLDILRFDITGTTSSGGSVPAAFNPITAYNLSDITATRNFALSMVGGPMNMHRINGLFFDMNRIDWQTPLYALEEWKISNATNEYHPMHSHGLQFQVYSRTPGSLSPNEIGWKDTVLVGPYETVRTLVKFNDYKGIYLYHCHNLEHEDDGMMLNFKVIDPIGIHTESTEVPGEFKIHQNFPNPFNPSTKIMFDIPQVSGNKHVRAEVFNMQGKQVVVLVNQQMQPGTYSVDWDASGLASGVYVCKITAGEMTKSIKMSLVK
jgi:FtsP/CotA-like multicopper oxidase with cupredoxin domain